MSLFPDSLLVTEIYTDSILALKLLLPYEIKDSVKNAISNGYNIDFSYEKCVLKKMEEP